MKMIKELRKFWLRYRILGTEKVLRKLWKKRIKMKIALEMESEEGNSEVVVEYLKNLTWIERGL